jgi:hypothetical protein
MITSKRRKIFFWLAVILFLTVISFQDLAGLLRHSPDSFYYLPDTDVNVYFSYLDQAREGRFLFYNQFTSEGQPARLFFPLWAAGGYLGELINLNNQAIYLILKLLLAAGLLYLLFRFFEFLLPDKDWIWTAWLMAVCGGGSLAWGQAHDFLFMSLLNPLVILALILILGIFWLTVLFLKQPNYLVSLSAGLLVLLLTLIHPYDALMVFIVLSLQIVLIARFTPVNLKKYLIHYLIILLGIFLGYLYYFYLFYNFPAFAGWLSQNVLPHKGLVWFVKAFGLFYLLAVLGLVYLLKDKKYTIQFNLIISWLGAVLLFLILPIFVAAKLFIGLTIPLGILAGYFILRSIRQLKSGYFKFLAVFLVIIILSLYNLSLAVTDSAAAVKRLEPFYLPLDYLKPVLWLKNNLSLTDTVLASEKWDTFIGGRCACRIFVGGNQTNQAAEKIRLLNWFYGNNLDDEIKREFLKAYNIDYVYFSPAEKEKGDFRPQEKDYLTEVYNDGWAQIFKVISPDDSR